ncbi:Phosphatidate cytidylyltransferase [Thermogutta terrifontis]|uniref:Phosphatidate cytidylyltransferase n=1 Tax=Thermogutta terrifontis TaxID=1331910 RepID=A0A286RK43_9BACT|nr:phosphatidate cytidylyltransferase [Thermogutta terrifontis]ASV76314.1 Phosphatidate cytidylyltransferase [Thermogutta terrifontis]
MDVITWGLLGGVLLLLIVATVVVHVLRKRRSEAINPDIVDSLSGRLRAWWLLFAGLAGAMILGKTATVVLFGMISFWSLREFITLTPTRPGDHRALFWVFVLCTPAQYVLVGLARYELFAIIIPVYALLFIHTRIALSGDPKRFLERTAKIQMGLLICVYCLSYAPAILTSIDFGNDAYNLRLLFFLVFMTQLSDALHFAWSQLPSRHVIVPEINPTKTWEGLLGGTASVTLVGAMLWWVTPFDSVWIAAALSLAISVAAFAGSLTMSAIKRDRGVKDYGTLVAGHTGVLDRIDSLCFAAPVFFHLTQIFLATHGSVTG